MAKQDNTTESTLDGVSSQYRMAAGLDERTSDTPRDLSEGDGTLNRRTEPEGGYGGKDGITNASTLTGSEATKAEQRAKAAAETAKATDAGENPAEFATQRAMRTGEDVTDVKPAPETVAEEKPKRTTKGK